MTAAKLVMLLMLALWPLGSGIAAEVSEGPEEIVVTGRLPGPPLWKVSNGDKVLWIFPYLDWIPRDMLWDSDRVASVIAQSQEVLSLPETGLKWSPLLLMNPFFIRRSLRNVERNQRNPDGGTLQENLPPELYARFAALQARYFPVDPYPRELRPVWVGGWMMDVIRTQEGLVAGDDILKTIQSLVRRTRGIRRTEISAKLELGEDNFDEYEERLKAVWESIRGEQEQACFERIVRSMEEDLIEMKSRANSWAQGYIDEYGSIDEFHNASLYPFSELHACAEPFMQHEALADMITRVNQMWLAAADNALAKNASTLAILPINELVAEGGLLSELKARGYEVTEP